MNADGEVTFYLDMVADEYVLCWSSDGADFSTFGTMDLRGPQTRMDYRCTLGVPCAFGTADTSAIALLVCEAFVFWLVAYVLHIRAFGTEHSVYKNI